MWILILIIMHSEGPAVTNVPGFATKQHCEAAITRINALDNTVFTAYRTTCVTTGVMPVNAKAEKE